MFVAKAIQQSVKSTESKRTEVKTETVKVALIV